MEKMTARERIDHLLDVESFVELGTLVGGSGAGIITGYGTIAGRLVYLYSFDHEIDGGLITPENSKKIYSLMEMALKMGAPLIQIIDSLGARISDGLNILSAYGKVISMTSKLSGVVPQIAVIAGPCTGMAAVSASMSDLTIMVENTAEFYINPPTLIEKKQGKYAPEVYSKAEAASQNGSVHITVKNDNEAMETVKRLINYLPSNNLEFTAAKNGVMNKLANNSIGEISSKDSYEIREVIEAISDELSVIEIGRHLTDGVITAFITINGTVSGVVASNKSINEGRLDIAACEKATRFIKLCDSFNIPIITLVDSKGFVAKVEEENAGLGVAASKLLYSLAEANVPKVALIIGEAYGAGFITMAGKETAFDISYAWPTAKISISDPINVVGLLNKQEIASSENPAETEKELISLYMEDEASAFKAAEKGLIDDIINPADTAIKLYAVLDMLQSKRVVKYPKKHGSTLI
jgi:methylmalonyl-CoA decarboxylase subunit alpha